MQELFYDEMVRAAQAANAPEGYIKGIKMDKKSRIEYRFYNDWTGPNGEPLATFFEDGTLDHWVGTKNKKALAWKSEGPESGRPQAIYSKRADTKKGDMLYSKGHFVRGIRPIGAMKQGYEIGKRRLAEALAHG